MNKSYPVLKQTYEMTTFAETLPFEYSMLNGAAKPKITTSGENQTLKIESEMNDPVKEEYFMIPASNAPKVKISYNYKKFEKFNMHFDCQGKGLTDESATLLAKKMVNNKWHSNGITYFFNIEKEIGKKLKKMDNLEKLKYFYYYYKKNYSFSTLIASRGEAISSQTSMETTKLFQIFCDRYGIPYEVLMYSPRNSGATKSAISGDKLRWGLLAHVGKEDVYLTDFDAYSEFNVPARFMYGTEVFYVSPANDFSSRSAVFNGNNNYNKTEINTKATIDITKQLINVSAAYTIGGELKTEYYSMVNSTSDYFKVYDKLTGDGKEEEEDENELNFMRIHYYSDDFREVEKQDEEKERLRKSFDKMASKNKNETYEEFVESMYQAEAEVTKVNNTNTGISTINSKEPETIEFAVDHTLKNTVQLVGDGALAVELGRLIQTQAELAGLDDRKRVNDIDVNYQKQYIQKIEIALPAGYVPVNLDDFNTNVDNDLIGFVSVAKVEGNKLILTSTKTYKKVHADQKEWSKMMEALDASAHLFQKKLLLEKTN
ncbi:MAG: hypothetical protein IT244_06705 [Bacteroidia bacterium]|nr:hypothetical protein [Bacteroidia bacterium]